jgi:hypothetical protein
MDDEVYLMEARAFASCAAMPPMSSGAPFHREASAE